MDIVVSNPTPATHSLVGNFTGGGHDLNLVIGKPNLIQLFDVNSSNNKIELQLLSEFHLQGTLISLAVIPGKDHDSRSDQVVEIPPDSYMEPYKHVSLVSRDCRFIFVIAPKIFGWTVEMNEIVEIQRITGGRKMSLSPKLLKRLDAEIYRPSSEASYACLAEDDFHNQELQRFEIHILPGGPVYRKHKYDIGCVTNSAYMMIPVPLPLGGLILLSRSKILYLNASSSSSVEIAAESATEITTYSRLVNDMSHYFLENDDGKLFLLTLIQKETSVIELTLTYLGETTLASTLSCLSSAYEYKIVSGVTRAEPVKLNSEAELGRKGETEEKQFNLGAIEGVVCIAELGAKGSETMAFSGFHKYNSIHMVKLGWRFEEKVTRSSARLINFVSGQCTGTWKPLSASSSFTVATADTNQLLLAERNTVMSLRIGHGTFTLEAEFKLKSDVSCLGLYDASLGVVGSWEGVLRVCSVPEMGTLCETVLSIGYPRSVLLSSMEEVCFLFCGTSSGSILVYDFNRGNNELSCKMEVCVGIAPVRALGVFCLSENRPCVYALSTHLVFICYYDGRFQCYHLSNLFKDFHCMCALLSERTFAVGASDQLLLCNITQDSLFSHSCGNGAPTPLLTF